VACTGKGGLADISASAVGSSASRSPGRRARRLTRRPRSRRL